MDLKVIGLARDLRTATPVVYAQMPIADYLRLVGENFEEFSIQRRRESHKAYQRLADDIRAGALLPSITLAVKPDKVAGIIPFFDEAAGDLMKADNLTKALSTPGQVDILDGLQRTFIMSDIEKGGHEFANGQQILVEFWLEGNLNNLIYRIIILNAGQKPMSMRHQIELLFMSLRESIQQTIPEMELYTERENTRRRRAKKFPLSVIVSAYQAFITASPELNRENVIANQLVQETALDSSEEEISRQFAGFGQYLSAYADLDGEIFRIYRNPNTEITDTENAIDEQVNLVEGSYSGPSNPNWLATENVILAFFAAIAQFSTSDAKMGRVNVALQNLVRQLRATGPGSDPLGLETFERLRAGNNPRRTNVGLATRRLLTNGFKEFFRESGESSLTDCWKLGAE